MNRFIYLAFLVFLSWQGPAFADEVSEELNSNSEPVYDASGKVVSPENQLAEDDDAESKTKESNKKPEPTAVKPPIGQVPLALMRMGRGDYFSSYAFILDKKQRTLSVWKNTANGPTFVEAHPADMGRNNGDKMILGDKKTPEGIYFFQTTYRGNALDFNEYGSQAYTMDYPNLFDRREKKTGSGIWLHAIPETKTLYRGSRGCVVVRNNVIQSLEQYIDYKKTPIIVEEDVDYVSPDQFRKQQVKVLSWLDRWRESWEAMEIDKYMTFYSDEFYSSRMNKNSWKDFKTGLNSKYEYIRVQIAKPNVYVYKDEAIVRFLQGYNSDKNSDFGEKVLHLKKASDGEYKIIAENWSPLSSKHLALLSDSKNPRRNDL